MLGDFNARVGSGVNSNDLWLNERGPHGYGELNEAGKELLSFLSVNEATVCNTWFQKWPINKATWQHPGTKKGHCIDFAIRRQSQHSGECNTNHQMLRVKLLIKPKKRHKNWKPELEV